MQQLKGGHVNEEKLFHARREEMSSLVKELCSRAPLVLTWPTWFHHVSHNLRKQGSPDH